MHSEFVQKLVAALHAYEAGVTSPSTADKDLQELFEKAEEFTPHARLSDLFFWPDMDRTIEQVAEEAYRREQLHLVGGELEVLVRVRTQYLEAIAAGIEPFSNYADQVLAGIDARFEELGKLTH